MKNIKTIYWIGICVLLILVAVIIGNISKTEKKISIANPVLFKEYIQSYSSHIISKNDVIQVRFTNSLMSSLKNKKTSIFKIIPETKGEIIWKNDNILEFKPQEPLKSGHKYIVSINLDKLLGNVPKELKTFSFPVNVKHQTLDLVIDGVETTNRETFAMQNISGKIKLNDSESVESVSKCVKANIDGKFIDVEIEKNNDFEYAFKIQDINRNNNHQILEINYDGTPISSNVSNSTLFQIPPVNEFKILDIRQYQHPDQYINVIFSDPIEEQQLLDGIISLEKISDLKFLIIDNNIKVIPAEKISSGHYTLNIFKNIKNTHGKSLSENYSKNLDFSMRKPELSLKTKGSILPTVSEGQIISFSAVNIKAVDVRIIKIFENNILQFLQNNSISGDYNLNSVGRVVKTKTIDLRQTDVSDFSKWNSFHLNLSDIITPEPGAIYRVEINFRKENTFYTCHDDNNKSDEVVYLKDDDEWNWFTDYSYFNYDYDEYYYDYYYDYNYNYNDPCNNAYYGYKNAICSNILASDIGLIGKIGKDNKIYAFVTSLLNAEPVSGALVEVFDFQQQTLGSATTNSDGMISIEYNKKDEPFFIVASYNGQKSYLKLDSYKSLNTSEFDVSGEYIQNGTKAYIYTDRGVWRPGDYIYVGFILNETIEPLPVGHPIIFEVRNPRNQEIYREIQELDSKGFHVFKFRTAQNDPTGYYNAKFSIGGKIFSKNLMVETIKPNRLNINLNLDKDYITNDGSTNATINIKWLHGAVAADIETDVTMSLFRTNNTFDKFKDYNFNNEYSNLSTTTVTLFNGNTDDNGRVKFPVIFDKIKNIPGVLQATLTTKAFEKGGNFSITENSTLYYPYDIYVGMEIPEQKKVSYALPLDKELDLNIVAIDKNQKLIKGEKDIEVSVFYINSSWWYDYQDDNIDFISANYNNAISRKTIKCNNGKAKTTIEFSDRGHYLVVAKDVKGGHISSQQIYASNNSYVASSSNKESAEFLKFASDKKNYNVGENVQITIPAGNGNALISIENSGKVLNTYWRKTNNDDLIFSFKATPEMTPNIYVSVMFIQAHGDLTNDRPIRMYGIIPVVVEDPNTHLKPVIQMDEELLAESNIKIKISEEKGKAMSYTIAMVDEGLLSLTKFQTPNPWTHFFRKEALGVRTWDIYDNVIGAFAIDAGKMLSIGGGLSDISPEDMKQALRFKPMVKFLGPFYLEAGKSQTHEIELPQYIGSVRTMVVAGNNNAFGSSEKTTPVKKPLMLLGTAPRVLGTQELFKLPVTIFSMKHDIKDVNITVKTNDLLKINGVSSKNIKFSKEGEQYINFDIASTTKTGIAIIEIIATSGEYKSQYNIELDVRHVNSKEISISEAVVSSQTFETEINAIGIEGTNEATLEIYNVPPMNLEARLDYLISYPHGCIEQIVSAAFPQLYLDKLVDLSEKQKVSTQKNVNACLNRLSKYQLYNGGFAYWPGNTNVSEWGTNYAGHFILEAEKAGFSIPGNIKTNWLKYQKEKATKWIDDGSYSQLEQAYRLYTLALAGQADRSAMNRLKSMKTNNITTWRLASAYSISGKENIAKEMIANLTVSVADYVELSGSFGSSTRDKAFILETLTEINEKEKAFAVLKEISHVLGSERYCNTQTTAYSLLAISKYINKNNISENIDCTYTLNGKQQIIKSSKPVYETKIDITENATNKLSLKSNNSSTLYVRIVKKGIPEIGSETAAEMNIKMKVEYSYLNGKPIDITHIPQGTDFVATVTLSHFSTTHYYLNNIALTQIFPSGWEIINSRMYSIELGEESYYTYQDVRDDRILRYFDMQRNSTYTYKVMLNASYEGKYYLPLTSCETMYDDTNFARTKGMWVEVVGN